jgi:tripartite-type tricarboxylate transporter receptor subunit TctC
MGKLARRRTLVKGAATAAIMAAFPGLAPAQSAFPGGKPIRVLVGFAPGGGTDVAARIVTQQMSGGPLGTLLVENRSGASGMIAAKALAEAAPDGTTLMVATQTIVAVAPILYKSSTTFDALRDIAGVAMFGASPMVLVVTPSFAAKSVKDLIEMAKAKPGAINFGSGGVGSTPHLAAELFLLNAGVRMTHVPYRGEAPAIADVIGGQLPLVFANVSVATPQIKSGILRALAVTSAQRAPSLPDVPTLAESGVTGADTATWFCLIAPKATPRDVVQKINAEVRRALANPDLQKRFAEISLSVDPSSPEELDATIKSEIARWGDVIKRADIKAAD